VGSPKTVRSRLDRNESEKESVVTVERKEGGY